jgi:hypothetical protein
MVLSVTITIPGTLTTFKDRLASVNSQMEKIMKRGQKISGDSMVEAYRAASPVRSGRLRNSWRSRITGRFVSLETELKEALYVMEGTGVFGPKGGVITRSGGRKFAFKKEGRMLFLRFIRGMRARRIEPSMEASVNAGGEAVLDDVVVHLNG